jgi:hypothetical protein
LIFDFLIPVVFGVRWGVLGALKLVVPSKIFTFAFVANFDVLPVLFHSIIGFFKFPKKIVWT